MSLSSDIKRVLEIFNSTRDHVPPYREFEKVPLRSPDSTFNRETPDQKMNSSESVFDLPGSPGPVPAQTMFILPSTRRKKIFRPLEPPQVSGHTGMEEWPGLKAAVSDLLPALPPDPVKWPTLILTGLAGGSGRSTLTSVLTVENARHGRPTLLIDLNETSLYPYLLMTFRHEDSVRIGRSWTLYTYEPTAAPMVVVRPDPGEWGVEDEQDGSLARLWNDVVCQAGPLFGPAGHLTPLVLIDAPPMSRQRLLETNRFASMVLSPIKPDLPSLVSVKEMEKSFDRFEKEQTQYCERFYVLNRFVEDHPLHQDIYEIFRQILSRRLCPFVIPEDPTVELAMAKGASLLETFSESPAAISMTEVSHWISGKIDR